MGTWSSRGLRGSTLEDMINMTNDNYREKGLALIQKIPTPITPVKIDQSTRHITLAYFEKQSTVDYIGSVQGIPVCFDAKECAVDTFPMMNIHEHQISFMEDFEKQEVFPLLYFFIPIKTKSIIFLFLISERFMTGVSPIRKSFKYDEIDKSYRLGKAPGALVHYLEEYKKI